MNAPPLRRLRMILNTFVSGPQAWFFLADDRGYLREAGIAIEFTPGDTAANAVPKVATGDFDVGYGDMNALIELAARGGRANAVGVFATFTDSPYTIAVPVAGPVRTPRELEGKTLASHPNDAAMKMLPEFGRATGIDPRRIAIEIASEHHREMLPRLLAGEWAGMFGFVNTLRSAAIEAGIDPAASLRFLEYRQFVPDLYGMTLLATRRLAETEPDVVTGFVRAVNRGLVDAIADVDAAVEAVARRDPKIDRAANRARLAGTLALEMAGAEGARLGIGDVDDTRLGRAIDLIVAAKGYPHRPAAAEIFDRRFLPPLAERVTTLAQSGIG